MFIIYVYMYNILIYIFRSKTFFYCAMSIYILFTLFESSRVWFEKYKLEISELPFVNLGPNIQIRPFLYYFVK